jgi:predicted transcriptional regulator
VALKCIEERVLLLSIQPRFTDALVSGRKSVELRRSRMQATPGCQVVIYSSSPVKAVVATAVLEAIDCRDPEDLWSRSGPVTAVTKAEFDAYFSGAERAYGLHLRDIASLKTPVSLRNLREGLGVEPPQSFRYLSRKQAELLLAAVAPAGLPAPDAISGAPGAESTWMQTPFGALATLAALTRIRLGALTWS